MSLRPPYFELLAADRLSSGIKTAVSFALRVYSQNHPRIRRLLTYEDEVLLAVSLLLETGSVFQHAASFSEALYGLTRRQKGTPPKRPSATQLTLSFAAIVGWPYVKARLARWYNHLLSNPAALRAHDDHMTWRVIGLRVFTHIYPYGKMIADFVTSCYQILYLAGGTDYFSPLLHLLQLQIYAISPEELRKEEKMRILKTVLSLENPQTRASLSWMQYFCAMALKSYRVVSAGLRKALIFAIFFFKALEWWYYVGEEQLKEQRKLPIPPPPTAPPPHPDGLPLPSCQPHLCPLCRRERSNPTQLTVSGYVFCYGCIMSYVRRHGFCPITLLPANLNQLRRLYRGSSSG